MVKYRFKRQGTGKGEVGATHHSLLSVAVAAFAAGTARPAPCGYTTHHSPLTTYHLPLTILRPYGDFDDRTEVAADFVVFVPAQAIFPYFRDTRRLQGALIIPGRYLADSDVFPVAAIAPAFDEDRRMMIFRKFDFNVFLGRIAFDRLIALRVGMCVRCLAANDAQILTNGFGVVGTALDALNQFKKTSQNSGRTGFRRIVKYHWHGQRCDDAGFIHRHAFFCRGGGQRKLLHTDIPVLYEPDVVLQMFSGGGDFIGADTQTWPVGVKFDAKVIDPDNTTCFGVGKVGLFHHCK